MKFPTGRVIAAAAMLGPLVWAQNTPEVNGNIVAAESRGARADAIQLLERARNSYNLRSLGQPYDLRVSFTVNSNGQTSLDGSWQMEDVFDPKLGLRWTANGPGGYAITRIHAGSMLFGADTASYVPLRLHQARAALFDPLPPPSGMEHSSLRTSTLVYNGTRLTCVLLSDAKTPARGAPGRQWDESEECVDPDSGVLLVHSQAPGLYYAYDYSETAQLGDRALPRKVTVSEGGKVVMEISVDSLTETPSADAILFRPNREMQARGRALALGGAEKISRTLAGQPSSSGAMPAAVCVFGVVTADGKLMEAHSLEPADPNSGAAIADAEKIDFSTPAPVGPSPAQHFVFVIEKFAGSAAKQ